MTNPNSMGAEGRDDSDLKGDTPTPSHQGSSGGGLATEIGSLDEERNALGGDPEPTRVMGAEKIQIPDVTGPNDAGR